MKPICVPCQRFFRPDKNNIAFIEGMPKDNYTKPGKVEPHHWSPYKLWLGDQWRCPDCSATIIVGVGMNQISEHYMSDFAAKVESWNPKLQVNDC